MNNRVGFGIWELLSFWLACGMGIPIAYGFVQPSPYFVCIEDGSSSQPLLAIKLTAQREEPSEVIPGGFTNPFWDSLPPVFTIVSILSFHPSRGECRTAALLSFLGGALGNGREQLNGDRAIWGFGCSMLTECYELSPACVGRANRQ